jgi:prepilin-type N-terminal cleavage/methylation domain-containing protein
MKKAFTLIELMLVITLMGVMGTLAVGAYSAVTRGMSDRAALDAAASVVDAAYQRAQMDRTNTYLLYYDEVLRKDSDDQAGVAQGVVIAVRPCGRITYVSGSEYYDEFGDLNRQYLALEGEKEKNQRGSGTSTSKAQMRLYKLTGSDAKEVIVEEGYVSTDITNEEDLEEEEDGQTSKLAVIKVYGFKGVSGATFEVGDVYGQEFAVTRLPPGYTFSNVSMGSVGQSSTIKCVQVTPTSRPSLTIYARRANGSPDTFTTGSAKDIARQ